jgi:ABC-type uncharacterized transport system YnjBCD permease subunit
MPVRSFALRAKRLGRLVAGGAAVLVSTTGRVPTAAQGVLSTQPIAAPPQPQTYLTLALSTAVTSALVIFVAAFLLGFWCGWMWRRQRGTRL